MFSLRGEPQLRRRADCVVSTHGSSAATALRDEAAAYFVTGSAVLSLRADKLCTTARLTKAEGASVA